MANEQAFEREFEPTEPQADKVFILDGRGRLIEMEVGEDVSDN